MLWSELQRKKVQLLLWQLGAVLILPKEGESVFSTPDSASGGPLGDVLVWQFFLLTV